MHQDFEFPALYIMQKVHFQTSVLVNNGFLSIRYLDFRLFLLTKIKEPEAYYRAGGMYSYLARLDYEIAIQK